MLAMSDNSGGGGVNNSNGGKVKKPRKRYDILKTASCSVCGDQAAEHLHYGGIACYSCRAFFRRTVNSNRPILDCSGTQNCKINKETRKRCQWCRFEKCKLMGMKTSWVLTEEDKTKLAMRRESSPIAGINVGDGGLAPLHTIKKEEDGEVSQGCHQPGNISVKQRHPSSPMASPPIPDHFDQTGHPQFKSRTSPYFQPHHPGPEGTSSTGNPFFANQFYPFQTGFGGHKMASDPISSQQSFYRGGGNEFEQHGFDPDRGGRPFEAGQQASSLFPLNINKMQVSLSGNSDGVSFTIETHNSNALKKAADRAPPAKVERGESRSSWHEASDQRYPSPAPSPRDCPDSNPLRHHQQSRTIFRCVSSDSNPPSCSSPVGNPGAVPFARAAQPAQASSWLEHNTTSAGASSPEPGVMNTPPSRPESSESNVQVWKLDAAPAENSETSNEPRQPLQSFTLQETLFVEQLAAIDERVRSQVPMDPAHVRSFLNTAVFGTFITKITIMHAYQTCIKRIVRFANSLQDFVELPPDDMQKLLVANTVSIINIRIVRWLHPSIDLRQQLTLCGGGQEMFQEALEGGKVTEDGLWRVNYDDVFASPWCCDSYYEDRYKVLMEDMHNLTFDSTVMVLLSVMCLFNCKGLPELSAESTIVSHGQKFSLLLHRHLLEQEGSEEAAMSRFYKYQEGLTKLREMAEILINKRLIC